LLINASLKFLKLRSLTRPDLNLTAFLTVALDEDSKFVFNDEFKLADTGSVLVVVVVSFIDLDNDGSSSLDVQKLFTIILCIIDLSHSSSL
jgi:hypothetical protein